jgi:hypothetical protein
MRAFSNSTTSAAISLNTCYPAITTAPDLLLPPNSQHNENYPQVATKKLSHASCISPLILYFHSTIDSTHITYDMTNDNETPRLSRIEKIARHNCIVARARHAPLGTSPTAKFTPVAADAHISPPRSLSSHASYGVRSAIGSWEEHKPSPKPVDQLHDYRKLNKQTLTMGATTASTVRVYRSVLEDSYPGTMELSTSHSHTRRSMNSAMGQSHHAQGNGASATASGQKPDDNVGLLLKHVYRHDWLVEAKDRQTEDHKKYKPLGYIRTTSPTVVDARRMRAKEKDRARESQREAERKRVSKSPLPGTVYQRDFCNASPSAGTSSLIPPQ